MSKNSSENVVFNNFFFLFSCILAVLWALQTHFLTHPRIIPILGNISMNEGRWRLLLGKLSFSWVSIFGLQTEKIQAALTHAVGYTFQKKNYKDKNDKIKEF